MMIVKVCWKCFALEFLNFKYVLFAEALSSDEDDIDEMDSNYLDNLAEFSKMKADKAGFDMKVEMKVTCESFSTDFSFLLIQTWFFQEAEEKSDGEEEEDDDDDDLNETALESYTTPIDEEETDAAIDEYMTFKEVFTCKFWFRDLEE